MKQKTYFYLPCNPQVKILFGWVNRQKNFNHFQKVGDPKKVRDPLFEKQFLRTLFFNLLWVQGILKEQNKIWRHPDLPLNDNQRHST